MSNPYEAPESINLSSTTTSPIAGGGQVSSEVFRILQMTKGWVRFLAVLGFISTVLMVIASVGIMLVVNRTMMGGLAIVMGAVYLVFAILNFLAAFKLNQYASRIADMLMRPSELTLVAALEAQRGFWKYVGVMAIVVLSMYLLAIGAGMLSAQY